MKKVLVLDANQRSALAVTRSLGKRNIDVFTAEETVTSLAGASKFSIKNYTYPSPASSSGEFIEALSKLVKQQHIDMLLPMTELTALLLLEHRSLFPSARLPFPDINTVDSISDKCSLMHIAEKLHVPIPDTLYIENPEEINNNLESLPYPVVIKPGKSWIKIQHKWCRTTVRYAGSPQQARNILDTDSALKNHPFMIQQHISGHGQGVFSLYENGTPVAFFAHRRLREKPPSGGVSVLSQSIPVEEELGSYTRKLLDHAGWHGVAMAEFKISHEGKPYLMEINTRFWGSLQLAIDAGIDFPWLLYQAASGEMTGPVVDYRKGVKLRWLLGDLDSLYLVLRDPVVSTNDKFRAAAAFLTPSPFKTRHEVNRWGDMRPFWWELRQYVSDLLN